MSYKRKESTRPCNAAKFFSDVSSKCGELSEVNMLLFVASNNDNDIFNPP